MEKSPSKQRKKMTKKMRKIVFSWLTATFIFFIVFEITIRIYTSFFIYYDIEMTKYANEIKVKSDDEKIGHEHKPHSQSYLMGVDVQINSDGFRYQEYTVKKEKDTHRIIFLGDSLTFGWGVKKEQCFEHVLERELSSERRVEIINFGTGNYNTEQQVHLFLKKGLRYNPDHVVVFFFINDAEITPKKSPWNFLSLSRSCSFVLSRLRSSAIFRVSQYKSYKDYYTNLYHEEQSGWKNTKKAFHLLQEVCIKNSIELQVIMLPELHNLQKYPFAKQHQKLSNFLNKKGIDYLDLAPQFKDIKNVKKLWVALDDAHPNHVAHSMIASYSKNFISLRTIK